MPAPRRLAPALVLLLALAACSDGGLLGGPAPAGQASASPGVSGVTIAGGAKVLSETSEVRVIQQVLPRGAKTWLRLPYREFYIAPNAVHQIKVQLLVAEATPTPPITWTSSDPKIVSVEKGLLQSHGLGDVTITAEAGGQKVTMRVSAVGSVPVSQSALGTSAGGGTGGSDSGSAGTLIVAAPGEEGELVYARQGAYALMYNGGSAVLIAGGSDGVKSLNSKEAAPFVRRPDGGELGVETTFVLERTHLFVHPREGLSATLAGTHLYVFGGYIGSVIEKLDPAGSLPFEETALSLVTARSYHATVDTEEWVALIGGEDGTGTPLKATESATKENTDDATVTALGAFEAGDDMQQARAGVGAVRVGSYVFAIGGRTEAGVTASIERGSIGSGKPTGWVALPEIVLNEPRAYHQVVRGADNSIYVLGGVDSSGLPLESIERAIVDQDGSITRFEYVGRLQFPRSRHAATYANSTIIVAGGRTATGTTRDVEFVKLSSLSPAAYAQPAATPTPSATATGTPTPAATGTPRPTPTVTPTPTPAPTATATATPTPVPTATPTQAPTATPTPAGP